MDIKIHDKVINRCVVVFVFLGKGGRAHDTKDGSMEGWVNCPAQRVLGR